MTIKERITQTLEEAMPELEELKDEFFIFGSSAMILKDIPIEETKDIDILVSKRDGELLEKRWSNRKQVLPQKKSTLFRSGLSVFHFEQIDIECSTELEVKKKGKWEKLDVSNYEYYPIGEGKVKIPSLPEQKRILTLFGREKDLQKIKLIYEYENKKQ